MSTQDNQEEIEELQFELTQHQLGDCWGNAFYCRKCAELETAIENLREAQSGSLMYIGVHKLGNWARYHYYSCKHCSTDYPVIEGRIMCNGREIFDCSCQEEKNA